jgi:hypothetical protein
MIEVRHQQSRFVDDRNIINVVLLYRSVIIAPAIFGGLVVVAACKIRNARGVMRAAGEATCSVRVATLSPTK